MIFRPELAKKVLSGEKTVTRRRLVHRDGKPIRYHEGRQYAVQPGRGRKHVGHLCVIQVTEEKLRETSQAEANAEGFVKRTTWDDTALWQFMMYWMSLHGGWDPEEVVAVIRFHALPRRSCCARLRA